MRKLQKKAQKTINKSVHALNKNVLNDYLWRGRFYAHQVCSKWDKFDDNSGGELSVLIEYQDKKTGLFKRFWANNYNIGWKLWEEGNNFIVLDSHVWDDIDLVKNDKTDWSKVKFIPKKEIF